MKMKLGDNVKCPICDGENVKLWKQSETKYALICIDCCISSSESFEITQTSDKFERFIK